MDEVQMTDDDLVPDDEDIVTALYYVFNDQTEDDHILRIWDVMSAEDRAYWMQYREKYNRLMELWQQTRDDL